MKSRIQMGGVARAFRRGGPETESRHTQGSKQRMYQRFRSSMLTSIPARKLEPAALPLYDVFLYFGGYEKATADPPSPLTHRTEKAAKNHGHLAKHTHASYHLLNSFNLIRAGSL